MKSVVQIEQRVFMIALNCVHHDWGERDAVANGSQNGRPPRKIDADNTRRALKTTNTFKRDDKAISPLFAKEAGFFGAVLLHAAGSYG